MLSEEKIRNAKRFACEWRGRGYEKADDQTFWNQLLSEVLGVERVHHEIEYQRPVKIGKSTKWLDAYIASSKTLIEQKSIGIDLTAPAAQSGGDSLTPYEQAVRYAAYLPASESPDFIITSNFESFRIHDRRSDPNGESPTVILLEELPEQLQVFGLITDPINAVIERQTRVSKEAAGIIGSLYGEIRKQYPDPDEAGHDLASLMVRIIFCLYAEDSGLFEKSLFYDYLKDIPAGQGFFREALLKLFRALNTPAESRDKYLGEILSQFPYVNGGLFADEIEIPIFTDDIKHKLLDEASRPFDWSKISPVIFGSIFESILSGDERRAGGMHYTSVENIRKLIDPLFLDGIVSKLRAAGGDKEKLRALQDGIAGLRFLDPACGSGNFLTQTYLELRNVENKILEQLVGGIAGQTSLEVSGLSVKVGVGQFYGIEINDFAVAVANAALWIADHQANVETSRILSRRIVNLPLVDYKHIVAGNALRMDWADVVPKADLNYILGNPPFVASTARETADKGSAFGSMTPEQKEDRKRLFGDKGGVLDFVSCWFKAAADYTKDSKVKTAFVATNSICQGQQVQPLWEPLFNDGVEIDFAHPSFLWKSEADSQAFVYVVIIGFSHGGSKKKYIYSRGTVSEVAHINAYLASANDAFVEKRTKPLCAVPLMTAGGKPTDGGNLILSAKEKNELILKYPELAKWIKPFSMGAEFINAKERFCLWFVSASPRELRDLPSEIRNRIAAVKETRLASTKPATQLKAETPWLFDEVRPPDGDSYIAVPKVSSDRRKYVPIGFVQNGMIPGDKLFYISNAGLYEFGILTSQFQNAWMRAVGGRYGPSYSYSNTIVYNTYVWPKISDEQRKEIEASAQIVLDARANYPDSSLADLYDPDFMPTELRKAHNALDKAVEKAYKVSFNGDEEAIVSHLFKLYAEKTS